MCESLTKHLSHNRYAHMTTRDTQEDRYEKFLREKNGTLRTTLNQLQLLIIVIDLMLYLHIFVVLFAPIL